MEANDIYKNELRRHLKRILVKTAALRLGSGFIGFLAVGAWVFLCLILWTVLTDSPPLWQVIAASRTSLILLAALFFYFVLLPLIRLPSLGKLAAEVEARKDFQDIVRAGYEFSSDQRAIELYAPDLVREVIRQAVRSIEGLEVRFLFLTRKTLLFVPVAYGALLVMLAIVLVKPAVLFDAGKRVLSPGKSAAVVHEANLFVSPGDKTVLSGSDVEVSALDFGEAERPVHLKYNLMNGFWKEESTTPEEPDPGASFKRHHYTFKNLRSTVSYYFMSGKRRSSTHTIRVVHKPIVTNLKLTLTPPAYTGEPSEVIENSGGNIKALEGTKVVIEGVSNNMLRAARVAFDEEDPTPVTFKNDTFWFEFTALKDGSYTVLLEDTLHHKTDDPLVHTVEVFDDHPPSLDVLEPSDNPELPRNYRVDMSFAASDDYGIQYAGVFSRMGRVEQFLETVIPLEDQTGKKEVAKAFTWNLEEISFFPGDYIEFYIEVRDNNTVTGPGVARSRMFHLSAPTMAELYEKIRKEETERSSLFEEAIKEGEILKDRLEKLEREFIKTEKFEWSQKKEIDKAVASQQSIEDKIEEIQKSLSESLQSMSDNRMTSQQIGEKLEEIQELLEEINSDILEKYINKLQESMEKLTPEDIRKALEELNLSAEELLEKLERTANLLEEIRKEQRMEELVRESEELMDNQRELNEKTGEADAGEESEMKELSEKQSELADKTSDLKNDIEDFAKEVNDAKCSSQLQEASRELSRKKTSQKMQNASEEINEGQIQKAQQNQSEALEDMVNLFRTMSEAQAAMQSNMRQRMAMNLQRFAKQTLRLSFKQEDLAERLEDRISVENPGNVRSLAEEQQSYYKALEQLTNELGEVAKTTLLISPELLRKLGESLYRMQSAILFLEQNEPFMSFANASQAVGSLNEATIKLLETLQQCSTGGSCSGAGIESLMQQLLSGEQQIIQQTKEMLALQLLQEQMRQQQQAELRQLAGQQRALQDVAEDIQRNFDENKEILGRLDKMIEDMEEVLRDFESGMVNERTLEVEQRILSRLLDAQRSVHTRDYETTRTSTTAEDIFSRKLGRDPEAQDVQTLREAIQRAMKLKAPGEFEELIRLYFRALAEEAVSEDAGGNE